MKYLTLFLFSFLFAFKNELYLKVLENNVIISFLNSSVYKTKEFKINPKIKKIIDITPDKFIVGNIDIDSKGNKRASIGIEFDLNKKKKSIILSDNSEIFKINKIFKENEKIIKCYENQTLFNLKLYFLEVMKYDNFYSQFLPPLKYANPCHINKQPIFFKLKKEKNDVFINFNLKKKREITSKFNINLNQDTNTYISASFNIKIPLQKSYSNEDLTKIQNLNNSLNKIHLLILKINNSIDNYNDILKKNKILIQKLKLLTLISKVAPANMNYEKLIAIYQTFFNNLLSLNSIQRDIFINKFLLKIEKRKISGY